MIEEYGIVLLPDQKHVKIIDEFNKEITSGFPTDVIVNHWHVTLYHGAFNKGDLPIIKSHLFKLKTKKLNLKFNEIYSQRNRYICWKVENTPELNKIHEDVVKMASIYHHGLLQRVKESYATLDNEKKAQADQYGVSGVMKFYYPHMTLFYSNVEMPLIELLKIKVKLVNFNMNKIAIGKLGYNGNVTEIIFSIELEK